MTDYNKEADLILEWLKYRIDWFTNSLLMRSVVIDLGVLGINLSIEHMFKLYMQQGILLVNSKEDYKPVECLTFEEWKQLNKTK